MAERETLDAHDAHSSCGCSPAKKTEASCPVIACGHCEPQTVKVRKKGERRIKLDFASCEWCYEGCEKGKYFLLGIPKGHKKNGPFCVDSNGQVAFTSLNMNQDTGELWVTVNTLDPRLNNGEIRHFEWMVQGPDMTRKPLEFYICVGK